jgi:5-methylcytosine-specific restriction endonuclease McrA
MTSSSSHVRLRTQAFQRQDGRCCYCGVLMWSHSPNELPVAAPSASAANRLRCTAKHLHARADGGRDTSGNIAAACAHCNRTRHRRDRPPEAEAFLLEVVERVAKKKWHPSWVYDFGLL